MKKVNNLGYMLVETLVVSLFVCGMLIFLYVQFNNLNNNYNESFVVNMPEDLYSLENIKNYIISENNILNYIDENIDSVDIVDLKNYCTTNAITYCNKLIDYENLDNILITKSDTSNIDFTFYNNKMINFTKKIQSEGNEKYRLIGEFSSNRFATIRFGDINE